ncbi:hypothetical protein PoB_000941300 [Plakobranchus ocellatus]|uniref:Uncharacterized protein n=1 Tax=Plakobranchus ocellatus TaxID=259542 RepID=A0AAV3YK70_9GAST|nr:hypothetical protein PoB_000941300 [Plakobranchus ocellatus]
MTHCTSSETSSAKITGLSVELMANLEDMDRTEPPVSENSSSKDRLCKWTLSSMESGDDCDDTEEAQDNDENAFSKSCTKDISQEHNAGTSSLTLTSSSSPTQTAQGTAEKNADSHSSKRSICQRDNENNNSDKMNNNGNANSETISSVLRRSHVGRMQTSAMHKSSSLSSISEEEMLYMMEKMGQGEIMSALPPCDCDDCLLNDQGPATNIVPPENRKLIRVSVVRVLGCFTIIYSSVSILFS